MAENIQTSENELIKRCRYREEEALDSMLRRYLPMVRHIVSRYHYTTLEREDLLQEGLIGLYVALMQYDETYGIKFSSFAYICILRKVLNAIKQSSKAGNKTLNEALSLNYQIGYDENRALIDLIEAESGDPWDRLDRKNSDISFYKVLKEQCSLLEFAVSVLLTEGYSTSEIENVLGIEAKVIDNARTRLKRKLSRLLLENGSVCQAGGKKRRKREDLYYQLPCSVGQK
ncbi:MAG TPA: sigma-70 family RNA polymerase sigma factor [Firmicutes bacterium]|nr:sigma-70 family RNA polymerase sigma factor [Bacillota bacterium]